MGPKSESFVIRGTCVTDSPPTPPGGRPALPTPSASAEARDRPPARTSRPVSPAPTPDVSCCFSRQRDNYWASDDVLISCANPPQKGHWLRASSCWVFVITNHVISTSSFGNGDIFCRLNETVTVLTSPWRPVIEICVSIHGKAPQSTCQNLGTPAQFVQNF